MTNHDRDDTTLTKQITFRSIPVNPFLRRLLSALAALLLPLSSFADPVVTDVVAKQRYPWNGKVDIACTVSGLDEGRWTFSVAAVNPDSGDATTVSHVQVMRDGVASNDLKVQANGNYRLVWDASADLGEVVYSNMVVRVEVIECKVQLWEGGPYWAETNIGAEKPEDSGLYFWWGDTMGYRREGNAWVASDGSSSNFSFIEGNAPTYRKDNSTLQSEGWITADGALAPEHDAARVHWGGAWRMPTITELNALVNNCDWSWTTRNGVNGYLVRGRGDYSANSIFLPAAGYGDGTSLYYAGSYGYYWSSVPYESNSYFAWGLYFDSGSHDTYYDVRRYYGRSVRPVQGFAQ